MSKRSKRGKRPKESSRAAEPDAPDYGENESSRGVLELLGEIRSQTLSPRAVTAADRCRIVEYLIGEGVSLAEIAPLLQLNERTIRRDLEKIREANRLAVGDGFADRLAGEYVIECRASIARIRRTTREKDCPHAARVDGERAVVEAYGRMIQTLQSLGYLPTATQRIRADLSHSSGEDFDIFTVHTEVERLIAASGGEAKELTELAEVTRVLVKADAAANSTLRGGKP